MDHLIPKPGEYVPLTEMGRMIAEIRDNRKPTIPEVIERFRAYHSLHPVWGSLHVVMEDGNFADCHVRYAIGLARYDGDAEGACLGQILLRMSKTQRSKLSRIA